MPAPNQIVVLDPAPRTSEHLPLKSDRQGLLIDPFGARAVLWNSLFARVSVAPGFLAHVIDLFHL
jgi:hypothetical protein